MKQSIVTVLSASVSGVDFTADESSRVLYRALERPLACVSFDKLSLTEASLGNYFGGSLGRRADVSIGLSIFCAEVQGAGLCADVFDRICEALLFDDGNGLREVSCGSTVYVPKREAFQLDAVLGYGLLFVKDGDDQMVEGFRLLARPSDGLERTDTE